MSQKCREATCGLIEVQAKQQVTGLMHGISCNPRGRKRWWQVSSKMNFV